MNANGRANYLHHNNEWENIEYYSIYVNDVNFTNIQIISFVFILVSPSQ